MQCTHTYTHVRMRQEDPPTYYKLACAARSSCSSSIRLARFSLACSRTLSSLPSDLYISVADMRVRVRVSVNSRGKGGGGGKRAVPRRRRTEQTLAGPQREPRVPDEDGRRRRWRLVAVAFLGSGDDASALVGCAQLLREFERRREHHLCLRESVVQSYWVSN